MRIAELFLSIQGEGLLAGTPSVFVRSSGCNLRCRWCDTPFTSWRPEGEDWSVERIVEAVEDLGGRHVVLTGGEPLVSADAAEVCRALRADGRHLTIETAGTALPAGMARDWPADLLSISPKLASSAPPPDTPGDWRRRHEATRRRDDLLTAMFDAPAWQLKFVVGSRDDLDETLAWLDALERAAGPGRLPRHRVFVMPEGTSPESLASLSGWLAPACADAGLRLAPRHHIAWFGNRRGT